MLSLRYDYDGKSLLNLNELQLKMKQQIERKIEEGIYAFEEMPCPVCDGGNFELLAKKDRYGLYSPVVICRDCGLIQTNPRMNQKSYNDFYNVEYRKLYVGTENPSNAFFRAQYKTGRRIFKYLKSSGLFRVCENMLVLEVGCGAGGILHYFREMGCRVKGIDLGEEYIEFGRIQHDLDLSVGTINNLGGIEIPDLIIYSHVLEHIPNPNEEIQQIRNILSNKGILYIEIPGVKNLMHNYGMDFLKFSQNAHVYHFSLTSLKNLFIKNGFDLLLGNETVNSVFRKSPGENSSREIENDYSNVLTYLHKAERLRKFIPITPHNIKKLPKAILYKFLKGIIK